MWVSTSPGEYRYVGFFEVAGGGRVLAPPTAGNAAVKGTDNSSPAWSVVCVLEQKIDSSVVLGDTKNFFHDKYREKVSRYSILSRYLSLRA